MLAVLVHKCVDQVRVVGDMVKLEGAVEDWDEGRVPAVGQADTNSEIFVAETVGDLQFESI